MHESEWRDWVRQYLRGLEAQIAALRSLEARIAGLERKRLGYEARLRVGRPWEAEGESISVGTEGGSRWAHHDRVVRLAGRRRSSRHPALFEALAQIRPRYGRCCIQTKRRWRGRPVVLAAPRAPFYGSAGVELEMVGNACLARPQELQ